MIFDSSGKYQETLWVSTMGFEVVQDFVHPKYDSPANSYPPKVSTALDIQGPGSHDHAVGKPSNGRIRPSTVALDIFDPQPRRPRGARSTPSSPRSSRSSARAGTWTPGGAWGKGFLGFLKFAPLFFLLFLFFAFLGSLCIPLTRQTNICFAGVLIPA